MYLVVESYTIANKTKMEHELNYFYDLEMAQEYVDRARERLYKEYTNNSITGFNVVLYKEEKY